MSSVVQPLYQRWVTTTNGSSASSELLRLCDALDLARADTSDGFGLGKGFEVSYQMSASADASCTAGMANLPIRDPNVATLGGMEPGIWTVTPYGTWTGLWGEPIPVTCTVGSCDISLPAFQSDIALRLER